MTDEQKSLLNQYFLNGATTALGDLLDELLAGSGGSFVNLAVIDVTYLDINAGGINPSILLAGPTIPADAVLKDFYFQCFQAFAGDGDSTSFVNFGFNALHDIYSNRVDSIPTGFYGNVFAGSDGPIFLTSAKQMATKLVLHGTDTQLVSGKIRMFVEWVQAKPLE
jgi:hypothetical protein